MKAMAKLTAAACLFLLIVAAAPIPMQMPAQMTKAEGCYAKEEKVAAVWLDFLEKKLRYPDSLQVTDIIARGSGASATLEIVYSAKNARGGISQKALTGYLNAESFCDGGIERFLILPDGSPSFPQRSARMEAGGSLKAQEGRRLDEEKVRGYLADSGARYLYYGCRKAEETLGWREKDAGRNEVRQ